MNNVMVATTELLGIDPDAKEVCLSQYTTYCNVYKCKKQLQKLKGK